MDAPTNPPEASPLLGLPHPHCSEPATLVIWGVLGLVPVRGMPATEQAAKGVKKPKTSATMKGKAPNNKGKGKHGSGPLGYFATEAEVLAAALAL